MEVKAGHHQGHCQVPQEWTYLLYISKHSLWKVSGSWVRLLRLSWNNTSDLVSRTELALNEASAPYLITCLLDVSWADTPSSSLAEVSLPGIGPIRQSGHYFPRIRVTFWVIFFFKPTFDWKERTPNTTHFLFLCKSHWWDRWADAEDRFCSWEFFSLGGIVRNASPSKWTKCIWVIWQIKFQDYLHHQIYFIWVLFFFCRKNL